MRIVGADLSLTATGIACDCGTHVIASKLRDNERLHDISHGVLAHATGVCSEPGVHPALVVVEGYGFHSMKAVALGELGGVVRYMLWREGIDYVEVAPALVKKFACGKGNAGKDEVLAAAIRRFGFQGSNNNEADAWMLYVMGCWHRGDPDLLNLTDYQREALAKIDWPVLA